jgi:hypothetical protein
MMKGVYYRISWKKIIQIHRTRSETQIHGAFLGENFWTFPLITNPMLSVNLREVIASAEFLNNQET